jgi:signal peptidase I
MNTAEASCQGAVRRWVRWSYRQAQRVFALIGLGVVLFFLCFNYSRVTSHSMKPTLQGTNWATGDRVITEKVSYRFRKPRRWEVITFRHDDGRQIMKRVVGLPGEKVQMLRGGRILINGEETRLPEELGFLDYFPFGKLVESKTVECEDGYFVLGDYTRDSDDSRYNGPVPHDRLIGRAWLIVGPSGRRGLVHP